MANDEELAPIGSATNSSGVPNIKVDTKTQEFVKKVEAKFKNRYNLSKFKYTRACDRSVVICPVHGEYLVQAHSILQGLQCKKCFSDSRKFTKDEFISKSKNKFGEDVLDYSLVNYVNSRTKIELICKIHGTFKVTPNQHLQKSYPCPHCGDSANTKTQEDFIKNVKEVWGDTYDLSEVKYNKVKNKITIICKIHGEFKKAAGNFLNQKQGCPECSRENHAYVQHWNYIQRCELNETLKKKSGSFYILEITSEDKSDIFLKVGITTNYRDRLSHYKKAGLSVKEISFIKFKSTLDSAKFESEVLKYIKQKSMKYIPKTKFKGWSECVELQYKSDIEDFCNSIVGAYL